MANIIFKRTAVRASTIRPFESGLSGALKRLQIARDDVALRFKNSFGAEWPCVIPQRDEPELSHRLSDVWLARRVGYAWERRDGSLERDYFLNFASFARADLVSFNAFLSRSLHSASSFTHGKVVGFRQGYAGLESDRDGTTVIFSCPGSIPHLMELFYDDLCSFSMADPIAPVFALVGFSGLHPYIDANGRCARFWMNVMFSCGPNGAVYLPLKAFAEASRGGLELRVREAELNGLWAPLVNYLATALEREADLIRLRWRS